MNRAERKSQKKFKQTLIHQCDVFIKKRTRVGSQWQELYVRVEEKAPCRMSTNSPRNSEYKLEEQQKFISPYTLYSLPMEIAQDARVILYTKVNGIFELEGFYEVKARPRDPSFIGHHYESPCENMTTSYEVKTINVPQPDGSIRVVAYLDV